MHARVRASYSTYVRLAVQLMFFGSRLPLSQPLRRPFQTYQLGHVRCGGEALRPSERAMARQWGNDRGQLARHMDDAGTVSVNRLYPVPLYLATYLK